jgi:division protein CdvB (Snf7/Vps24/ESCRT-III family)
MGRRLIGGQVDYKRLNKTLKEANRKLRQQNNRLQGIVTLLKAVAKELEEKSR